MNIFYEDPTIWVLVSFVIFVGLAVLFGRAKITAMLDAKIASIRTEIANAETLRDEARKMLMEYETRQKAAQAEAQKMLADAKLQAETMHAKAEADLAETMTRRETMMKDRIRRMEDAAMEDIRRYAADLAISATTEIISRSLDAEASNRLIDRSIEKISDNLN